MSNEIQDAAILRVEKINAEAIKEILVAADDMKRLAERLLKEHNEIMEQVHAIKTTSDIHHVVNNTCSSLEVVDSTLARTEERAKSASQTHAQINVLSLVLSSNFYGMPLVERAKECIEIYS
jgi:Holliday junction resolvasome RuvABC ATP-dependent DNA helicase subunit